MSRITTIVFAGIALGLVAGTAFAQPSKIRQQRAENEGYCRDIMASTQPPAECHAEISRGQVALIPAQAKGGKAPFPVVAALAHRGAVVASMRKHALKISVAESDRGLESTTIDLGPAEIDELARLDSPQKAEAYVRAKGQRCENKLIESACKPLTGK